MIEVQSIAGRFADASNATFLAQTRDGTMVVYKPASGQQPLWDFDAATLPRREVLTYRIAVAMGLSVVPETDYADGPLGPGSVQEYVAPAQRDYLTEVQSTDPVLWPVAVLDVLINNADRKVGHLLRVDGALRAIDHGLTFHPAPKLRTVLWGFAGRSLPAPAAVWLERAEVAASGELGEEVEERLGRPERSALLQRIADLTAARRHPDPPPDRPAVPWPPY